MKVTSVELEDKSFIQKESPACSLFLQITKTSARFLIVDQQQNVRLLQEIETSNLADEKSIYLNLRYEQVTILSLPETFIFIPEELYDPENPTELDQFLLLNAEEEILERSLSDPKITTRFTVSGRIQELQRKIRVSSTMPSPNLMIAELLSLTSGQDDVIGITLHAHEFEIAYARNKQFMFYNRFPKATADEFNYFLLAVFEQLKIDPALTAFHLSGEVSKGDENHARIEKYSAHTHFLAAAKEYPFPLDPDKANRYHQLLMLSRCV